MKPVLFWFLFLPDSVQFLIPLNAIKSCHTTIDEKANRRRRRLERLACERHLYSVHRSNANFLKRVKNPMYRHHTYKEDLEGPGRKGKTLDVDENLTHCNKPNCSNHYLTV